MRPHYVLIEVPAVEWARAMPPDWAQFADEEMTKDLAEKLTVQGMDSDRCWKEVERRFLAPGFHALRNMAIDAGAAATGNVLVRIEVQDSHDQDDDTG